MLFITLAASLMMAGAEGAQPAPAQAPAAATAEAPKPKMRKVCREDPAYVGTRLAKRICVLEPVPEAKTDDKGEDTPQADAGSTTRKQ